MIRPSSAAAAVVLLGAAGLWSSFAFVGGGNAAQIQLCAQFPEDAPEFMQVEFEASNPHKVVVESFSGPGVECATAIGVGSEQYAISAAVLKSKCWPLGVDTWADCAAPTLSYFEVQSESGGLQRISAADDWATITPAIADHTKVTAVFAKDDTTESGQDVGRLLRDGLFADEPVDVS